LVPPASGKVNVGVGARRGIRRARLQVRRIDPWSALKVSFIVSLCLLVVGVVAATVVFYVLEGMGVWDSVNGLVRDMSDSSNAVLSNPFTASHVIGITAIVGAINVILLTALATLSAFLYNLVSDLVGGVEMTFAQLD
jgi:hypothetical protein